MAFADPSILAGPFHFAASCRRPSDGWGDDRSDGKDSSNETSAVVRRLLVASASVGMVLPQGVLPLRPSWRGRLPAGVRDVALHDGGSLTGQVLDAAGTPVSGTAVAVIGQGGPSLPPKPGRMAALRSPASKPGCTKSRPPTASPLPAVGTTNSTARRSGGRLGGPRGYRGTSGGHRWRRSDRLPLEPVGAGRDCRGGHCDSAAPETTTTPARRRSQLASEIGTSHVWRCVATRLFRNPQADSELI